MGLDMPKNIHEIRDPIHVFVRMDNYERRVLNSRFFQRLRHVHQLALTYLIYPGATHKRFEHSLGVMELASRAFDVVTNPENINDNIRELVPPIDRPDELPYWRRVLRMAALCHDVGHLPFSHAAEKHLLPEGWDHERLTREIIQCDEMKAIWNSIRPPFQPDDVVKLALGPEKAKDLKFDDWETILSEIIVGDAFGVDRMDYLLRDSHHAGVAYGRFDHYRLIDTLRILPVLHSGEKKESEEPALDMKKGGIQPLKPSDGKNEPAKELVLGVEEGGIQSAEALLLARYFMYSQVYFHPIRRVYDIHLMDFLKNWLEQGEFSTDLYDHYAMTDNEVTAAFLKAANDENMPGHIHAERIVKRRHFKIFYERNPNDVKINPEAGNAIHEAACRQFGAEHFRHDRYSQKGGAPDFPVRLRDGQVVSSIALSETLNHLPVLSTDYVFVDREIRDKANAWCKEHHDKIVKPEPEE